MGHQNHRGKDRYLCYSQGCIPSQRDVHNNTAVDIVDHGRGPDQSHTPGEPHTFHDRAQWPGQPGDGPHFLQKLHSNNDGDHNLEKIPRNGHGLSKGCI